MGVELCWVARRVPGQGPLGARMVAFADKIPTLRIAVELKVEVFRNTARPWNMNAIHDIDALSFATSYCHAILVSCQGPVDGQGNTARPLVGHSPGTRSAASVLVISMGGGRVGL